MIYVVEGTLHVEIEGTVRVVETGDFTVYSSAQPYAYVNPGAGIVRFVRNVVV